VRPRNDHSHKPRNAESGDGFTINELLLVITILAVLAAIVAISVSAIA
jgi:prepilin-type N-terminal cleavage/methylation domain-containing protein